VVARAEPRPKRKTALRTSELTPSAKPRSRALPGPLRCKPASKAGKFWYQGEAWYRHASGSQVWYVSPTRLYQAEDGRFVERDPLLLAPNIRSPEHLAPYRYPLSPVNSIDPLGLDEEPIKTGEWIDYPMRIGEIAAGTSFPHQDHYGDNLWAGEGKFKDTSILQGHAQEPTDYAIVAGTYSDIPGIMSPEQMAAEVTRLGIVPPYFPKLTDAASGNALTMIQGPFARYRWKVVNNDYLKWQRILPIKEVSRKSSGDTLTIKYRCRIEAPNASVRISVWAVWRYAGHHRLVLPGVGQDGRGDADAVMDRWDVKWWATPVQTVMRTLTVRAIDTWTVTLRWGDPAPTFPGLTFYRPSCIMPPGR